MKVAVCWLIAPANLVEVSRSFTEALSLHNCGDLIALMAEAASTSKTSVPGSEDSNLYSRCPRT